MCHSFLLSLLFGALLAKLLWRFRQGGCSNHGGCGGHGWRGGWHGWRGSWHQGGQGYGPFGRSFGGQGQPFGGPPWAGAGRGRSLEALLRGLDLNQRQQDEAGPVLQALTGAVGPAGPRLEFALSVLAADSFDRGKLEGLLVEAPAELRKDLLEGLEHVHNILIPEQRAALRDQLAGKTPSSDAKA